MMDANPFLPCCASVTLKISFSLTWLCIDCALPFFFKTMAKQSRQENDTDGVRSKYFSIETYFKTPANVNKRLKPSTSDLQVEKAIQQQEEKKEQCPLCRLWILTESISMEVHVNQCLDMEQEREKENIAPLSMSLSEEASDSSSVRKDGSFSVEATVQSGPEEKVEEERDTLLASSSLDDSSNSIESVLLDGDNESNQPVAQCDTESTNTTSVQPSSWRTMFSFTSSSTSSTSSTSVTSRILGAKNVNASLPSLSPQKKTKQKPCPFYKRVRGESRAVD